MRGSKRGFTLLEFLVVTAIVAALTTVLVPVFSLARENGRTATCLSNCRQVAFAVRMYVDDHDSEFPGSSMTGTSGTQTAGPGNWLAAVKPYMLSKAILQCPDDSSPLWTCLVTTRRSSYGFNGYFFPVEAPYYGIRLAQVLAPATCIVASELADAWIGDAFLPMYWGNPSAVQDDFAQATEWDSGVSEPNSLAIRRHRQGSNYVFADSHVRWHFYTQTFQQVSGSLPTVNWYDPEHPGSDYQSAVRRSAP